MRFQGKELITRASRHESVTMNYRLTAADISPPARLDHSAWQRSQLSEDLGACFTDSLVFSGGLAVVYAHYTPRHDLLQASMIEREQSLTVAIALEGQSSIIGGNGERIDFVSGHSTIAAYAGTRGERRFPANQPIRQLRLVADEPLLHQYGLEGLLDGAPNEQAARQLFCGKHGAATERLAESLIHLHDHGGSLLNTHIAALGLLSEQLRPFAPQPAITRRIDSEHQDMILRARDILMSQFDRALTVGYLCAAVGTNEFKLKQGFHQLFGTSPHRMLTKIRMEKAWELLETGLRVSTVAYKVGYLHLSSFSAAFERYYGRTPKSVAGSRTSD